MAHKIDSASGSITLISEDGSGNVNLTLPRAGLGTAASADTGTAAGNIPVLDGSGQIASGVLTNAAVADNAITLAKMAHGTDGELITYDATGAPANVAVGTSGQVLTSGGAGVAPTFQTAAGGGADTSLSNLSATGEQMVCQAWVNFDGTGTVAINDSHNVSSITDNGTGNYNVNFTTAMGNGEYAVATNAESHNRSAGAKTTSTTTSLVECWRDSDAAYYDLDGIHAIYFGD